MRLELGCNEREEFYREEGRREEVDNEEMVGRYCKDISNLSKNAVLKLLRKVGEEEFSHYYFS